MDRLSAASGPLTVLGAQVPLIAIVHLLGI
jgi:hypothetical protein